MFFTVIWHKLFKKNAFHKIVLIKMFDLFCVQHVPLFQNAHFMSPKRNGLFIKNQQDVNRFNVIYHQNEAVLIMVANDIILQNMLFCSTQYSKLNFPSSHPIVFKFLCLCVCVFSMCNMCTYARMWAHSNMCTYARRDLCIHYGASLCVHLCLQDQHLLNGARV